MFILPQIEVSWLHLQLMEQGYHRFLYLGFKLMEQGYNFPREKRGTTN